MFTILMQEIETWPQAVQTVINYIQTPTIFVPVILLLWYVILALFASTGQ